jgi:hypothetical protein
VVPIKVIFLILFLLVTCVGLSRLTKINLKTLGRLSVRFAIIPVSIVLFLVGVIGFSPDSFETETVGNTDENNPYKKVDQTNHAIQVQQTPKALIPAEDEAIKNQAEEQQITYEIEANQKREAELITQSQIVNQEQPAQLLAQEKAPEPTTQPSQLNPTPIAEKDENCDSSYPTLCIPPNTGNSLNCKDVLPAKNFPVINEDSDDDPHDFDGDKDGRGCEK